MPRFSIIANGITPAWIIHLAEDGNPVDPVLPLSTFTGYHADQPAEDGNPIDPILPLSTFPGYQADQPPTTTDEAKSIITATLIDAGVIRGPTGSTKISLPEHATLKACNACHRWEHIGEAEEERLLRCSGCGTAWYCDERCAKAAWSASNHKVTCHYEAAVRLQISLEDRWTYFSTLRIQIESMEGSLESLGEEISRLAAQVAFIRHCIKSRLSAR